MTQVSDPVDISPNLYMDGEQIESFSGYKGKIFWFGEYGNLLQSLPISALVFLLLDALVYLTGLCVTKDIIPDISSKEQAMQ